MKNYLIPNKGNKYNPHVFKTKNLVLIFLISSIVVLVSYLGSIVVKNSGLLAAIQSAFLVDLTNKDRNAENIAVLTINPILVEAAQEKANDMASKGYFAHTSPEGLTPWYWFKKVDYEYVYAGENLAVNFSESIDVHKAWLASPTHKKNILDQRFTEIGIATAEGFYKGRKATFVVQMFGKPRNELLPGLAHKSLQENTVPIVVSGPDREVENEISKEVFGAQDEVSSFQEETSLIERVAVSPLTLGRIVISGIIVILLVALLFRLCVECKRHHLGRVFLLILLIGALLVLVYTQKHLLYDEPVVTEEGQNLSEA